jgi:hypothetical protein
VQVHISLRTASWHTRIVDVAAFAHAVGERLGPDVLATLVAAIEPQLDELAADLTKLYQAKIPVYVHFDPAVIYANTRLILGLVSTQLSDDSQSLSTDSLASLARHLADQGIPLDPVAHSVQLGARRISGILRERAVELGVSDHVAADVQELAWDWATEGAAVIHAVERDLAVASATRRADFLRQLVAGNLAPAVLADHARLHHLDLSVAYRVACMRPPAGGSLSDVVTVLRVHGATQELPVVDAVVDGMLIAVMPRVPDTVRQPVPVGLGPAVNLTDASRSYAQARLTLHIAEQHDLTGVLELADLGPRTLLAEAEDAAVMLHERHLAPLLDLGRSGAEVADTVLALLAHDRRVNDTASALHLHRNTIHYRLTRFGEVTGLDIDRTADLVLAWWLLNRRQLRDSKGGAADV